MNQLQYLQQLTTLQSHLIELKRFLVDQFPKNNSFSNQLLKEHFYDLQHTIGMARVDLIKLI